MALFRPSLGSEVLSIPPAAGCPAQPVLTLSPRGFSTLGLREKCMWRLPSSLTLTATFFRVLLPQWGQKTLVMSEVVL